MEDKIQEKDNYSNLNRSNKWMGIIDYKSLIIFMIIIFIMWSILGIFTNNTIYKIYVTIIISIPFLGVIYANKSEENISYIVYTVIRYVLFPKIYVYNIETNKQWLN